MFGVAVYLFRLLEKQFPVFKQISVVVKSMNVYLEPTVSNRLQVFVRYCVPLFRYDLKCSFDPELIVDIHQTAAEIAANRGLNIVSDNRAGLVTMGPKPDEGQPRDARGLHPEEKKSFEKEVYCAIQWPTRKFDAFPIAEVSAL